MILVTVSGSHLHKQAREDDNTNGFGGSALFLDLDERKRAARAMALQRRAGCDPALGQLLGRKLLEAEIIPPAAVVAGFWPLPGEIDIRPLLHTLHETGRVIVLPRTPPRGQALSFHCWTPGEALLPGRFGTAHPDGPALAPGIVLAPLLAFDRTGGRLGYGGGYYDRTLAALPGVPAIGCAFAVQEVDRIPAGPHDIKLLAIATERGVIHPARSPMRILFLGDTVGRSGREGAAAALPGLRQRLGIDLAVVNAENASHGFGLAPDMAAVLFAAGADVITLGNHAWDRKEIIPYIAQQPRLLRPLNFPPGTPGAGSVVVDVAGGRRALVMNAMGRLFMDPLDCPFRGTTEILARYRLGGTIHAAVMDFHAEATSEKLSFAHYFDGQLSLVVGTHTHVPTSDHQVLARGTAFQSDAGMCGDYDSVIGMAKEGAAARFVRKLPGERLAPAEGPATVCGLFVETNDATGLAIRAEPIRLGGRLSQAMPN